MRAYSMAHWPVVVVAAAAVAVLTVGCGGDDAENAEVTGVANDDDDASSGQDSMSNASNMSAGTTSVTTSTSTTATTNGTSTTSTTTTSTTTDPSADSSSTGDSDTRGCVPGADACECDNGECDGNLVCFDNVCGEPGMCGVDLFEDNNSEDEAFDLGDIGSSDSKKDTELTAVLDGGTDVDWFFYDGSDDLLSFVNPGREINTVGGLRLCKYVECVAGVLETEIVCPEGTAAATSDGGRPGCCGDDGFEIDLNCTGVVSDDARVFMRLDQGQQDCVQYTLDYHY